MHLLYITEFVSFSSSSKLPVPCFRELDDLILDMEIQLVIKAPNQNIDDQVIHCNLDWTVLQLKKHLSEVYPRKPVIQEQKLIYSGRLLHDHLQLKDILRHDDGQSSVHILHLVCNEKNFNAPQDQQSSGSSQDWSDPPVHSPPEGPNVSAFDGNIGPSSENSLRYRNNIQMQHANLPAQAAMPVFPNDPQIFAQMAAMQQMYAYYMTQYMQSINTAATIGSAPVLPDASNFQPLQNYNNANLAPNDTPAQRQPNQRMNAQGGQVLEENDDLANRDWLDHLFLCCRFFILFSIVYFYSSPERLMIVVVCAIIAFLYHEGWFVRRHNPIVPAEMLLGQRNRQNINNQDGNLNIANNANEQAPIANQNPSANEELHDGHEIEAVMDGDDPPHAQNPDVVNNNQIFSPFTFLASFFSSLIPEPPPPVNIN